MSENVFIVLHGSHIREAGGEDDNDDDEYEIDYANMNVSPEVLRMLGASEDVIAAKKAEIEHIKWVAPDVSGLEHSSAIAECDAVALGSPGREKGNDAGPKRIFATVGAYKAPEQPASPTTGNAESRRDVQPFLKVRVTNAPQSVPKKRESRLPPPEEFVTSVDSGSDTSWDEESIIDGRAWWQVDEDEVGSSRSGQKSMDQQVNGL